MPTETPETTKAIPSPSWLSRRYFGISGATSPLASLTIHLMWWEKRIFETCIYLLVWSYWQKNFFSCRLFSEKRASIPNTTSNPRRPCPTSVVQGLLTSRGKTLRLFKLWMTPVWQRTAPSLHVLIKAMPPSMVRGAWESKWTFPGTSCSSTDRIFLTLPTIDTGQYFF